MEFSELKEKAQKSLTGNYGKSIKLYFIYFLFSFVLVMGVTLLEFNDFNKILVDILDFIFSFIIIGVYPGFYSFFLKISRGEEVKSSELFRHIDKFWKCIGVSILASIFSCIGLIFLIIPGIVIALNYAMVYFVMVDNPEYSIMEVLAQSKRLMKGYRIDYVMLNLSFIGWEILSIFTFGLLLLWVAPYMIVTLAQFYNELKERA